MKAMSRSTFAAVALSFAFGLLSRAQHAAHETPPAHDVAQTSPMPMAFGQRSPYGRTEPARGERPRSARWRRRAGKNTFRRRENPRSDDSARSAPFSRRESRRRRPAVLSRVTRLVGIVSLGDIAVETGVALSGEAPEEISQPVHHADA